MGSAGCDWLKNEAFQKGIITFKVGKKQVNDVYLL